ncbi:hypothetical protein XENOCAPTIV_028413, partial [Xenoophorus captivus]
KPQRMNGKVNGRVFVGNSQSPGGSLKRTHVSLGDTAVTPMLFVDLAKETSLHASVPQDLMVMGAHVMICGPNSICNNQPGTFRCECEDGYQFGSDGRTCIGRASAETASTAPQVRLLEPFGKHKSYTTDITIYFTFALVKELKVSTNSKCEAIRDSLLGQTNFNPRGPRLPVGQYIPECDENGDYLPVQCHSSTRQCWCVDRNGQEIPGTRTDQGSRPYCKYMVVKEGNVLP